MQRVINIVLFHAGVDKKVVIRFVNFRHMNSCAGVLFRPVMHQSSKLDKFTLLGRERPHADGDADGATIAVDAGR